MCLAEESILSDDFLRQLINVGEVDLLIGVPTHNNARTVGQVVQAIRAGLLKYFPRERAVIINADGGSRDGSQDLVRAASISDLQQSSNLHALRTLHCISTQYEHGPASGSALHLFLSAAELVRANACAVFSPDSTTIEPEWVDRLLRPVVKDNFDLVTPIYCRHKFEGLLVRNLIYPMTRALYCQRIREPYPSEYAFSSRIGSHLLGQEIWSQDVARIGAEMLLTISTLTGGFQVAQSFLGPKSRVDHAPADLVLAMRQTVGVLFWSLEQNLPTCTSGADSRPVPTIGAEYQVSVEPLRVNRKRLHQMFVTGVGELEPVLRVILQEPTLAELQRAAALPEGQFFYSDDLWVRTVYEFAASYHKEVISRDHVVQALAPLYRGKAYTFLTENKESNGEEVEQRVESLCMAFEHTRPYLHELWNGRK